MFDAFRDVSWGVGCCVVSLCTTLVLMRCFRRCREAQRHALRDGDEVGAYPPWAARMRLLSTTSTRIGRGHYSRVPLQPSTFVGLPALPA